MVMAQRYAKMSEARLREAFSTMTKVMKRGRNGRQDHAGKVANLAK